MKIRIIFTILFSLALLWLGGYFWFLNELSVNYPNIEQKTDAIVVLTGGPNRLKVAVQLLEDDYGEKLYISGVDEKVTRDELLNLLGSSKELADCCIESGNQATDTLGNAIETMAWVTKNKIKSLRVVTSLAHMPRAMVEFKRFMPEIIFIEHPVGILQLKNMSYFRLSQEYSKYIISLFRARILDKIYSDIP